MSHIITARLQDEAATVNLGARLAVLLSAALDRVPERALCVNLEGDLGAGKTTLTRGLLRELGYQGTVKSPTYTLVESYQLTPEHQAAFELFHFDLYRLLDPEELELMGIRDYFAKRALCLIEWPDRGAGILPEPDLTVTLTHRPDGRDLSLSSSFFTAEELQSMISD